MAVVFLATLAAVAAYAVTAMRTDQEPRQPWSDILAASAPGWRTAGEGLIDESSWRYEVHHERDCWRVLVFDGASEGAQVVQPRGVAGCAPHSRQPRDPAAEARRLANR